MKEYKMNDGLVGFIGLIVCGCIFVIPIIFFSYHSWRLGPMASAIKRLMKDDPDGWDTNEKDYGYHKKIKIKIKYSNPSYGETFGTMYIDDVGLDIFEGYRIRRALRKLRGRKIIRNFKQNKIKKHEQMVNAIIGSG